MRIIFISEALSYPFDEGIKNVAYSLHNQLKIKMDSLSVTKGENITDNLEITKMHLNKLFLNTNLRKLINSYLPDIILYLPEASLTFNSFIRARRLKRINSHSKVVVLGVKHIKYSSLQKMIIATFLKPDYLMLLGRFEMDYYIGAGMKVKILPPSVDSGRFFPAVDDEKRNIRAEYNIGDDKTVVLHVGHIRLTRNVECFLEVQKIDNVQVVIAGSTSTVVENDLKDRLEKAGIMIISSVVPDISVLYKMSDVYVFPVFDKIACIDMPLSVLEAMACNLPVITTRFGGLTEYFKEDESFRYFDTIDELTELIRSVKDMDTEAIKNSEKVKPYTWSRLTDEIINACEELV